MYSTFSWGNLDSLLREPKAAGVNVHAKLLHHYGSLYSSNLMSLCVVGPQDLDEVERLVREYFGKIPDRGVERPWYGRAGSPWSSGSGLAEVFRIIPVKENAHEIHLTFPLPSMKGGAEAHNALPGADPGTTTASAWTSCLRTWLDTRGRFAPILIAAPQLATALQAAVGRTVGAWSVALLAICSVSALS